MEDPRAKLTELAARLVALQVNLLAELQRQHSISVYRPIATWPRYGVINLPDTIWGFQVHGVGIRFVDIRSLTIVDCDLHPEEANCFSASALAAFMESVGEKRPDVRGLEQQMSRDRSFRQLALGSDTMFTVRPN